MLVMTGDCENEFKGFMIGDCENELAFKIMGDCKEGPNDGD